MDCLIRNLTAHGAKVSIPNSVPLPNEFDLAIDRKGVELRSHVIWRRESEMGVTVSEVAGSRSDADIVPFAYVRRLAECEKEKGALKRRVELSSAE